MNLHEYYDHMADVSQTTREALESLEKVDEKINEALLVIKAVSGTATNTMTIGFSLDVTTNDVHRNLLFLQLLISQVKGVVQARAFRELLELTSYQLNEDEF